MRMNPTRSAIYAVVLFAAAAGTSAWAPAVAHGLTVALREDPAGVDLATAFDAAALKPFAEQPGSQPVDIVSWAGGIDGLKQGAGDWDLVSVSSGTAQLACEQAIVEKLDWPKIGGRDKNPSQGSGDCSVAAYVTSTVLTWDHEKLAASPSWSDFWDIAKYPGKRGLRKSAEGNLEIALLADGVSPGDVYRTLRTTDGIARAFRKLDQLKPYLSFWSNGPEAVRFLTSGDVLMTSAPTTAVAAAKPDDRRNFALQWNGGLARVESWVIPKAASNQADSTRLLAYLGDPKIQTRWPLVLGIGGLAKGANDGLPPEQQATSPSLPANLDKQLVIDEAFWRDNRDKLSQQFENWLTAR